MATLPTSSSQPMQPDTGQNGFESPPVRRTDTPKIEITSTEVSCEGPLSACDESLSEWEADFSHPDSTNCGDYRGGGAGSRRSEGAPGKSPSPSRSSPRRHSPVPYASPTRHRTWRQSAGSSGTSDDVDGGNLSPRRQPFSSPVSSSSTTGSRRPCSLPLTSTSSSTSEEFVCVTFSDPFCSPTIATTSDAILAITISGDHHDRSGVPDDEDDEDVEMELAARGEVRDVVNVSSSETISMWSLSPVIRDDMADSPLHSAKEEADCMVNGPSDPFSRNGASTECESSARVLCNASRNGTAPQRNDQSHVTRDSTARPSQTGICNSSTERPGVSCCEPEIPDVPAANEFVAGSGDHDDNMGKTRVRLGVADKEVAEVLSEAMEGQEYEEGCECSTDADLYSTEESSDDDMEDLLPPAALVPTVRCFEDGVTYIADVTRGRVRQYDNRLCHSDAAYGETCSCNDRHCEHDEPGAARSCCRHNQTSIPLEKCCCSCSVGRGNMTGTTDCAVRCGPEDSISEPGISHVMSADAANYCKDGTRQSETSGDASQHLYHLLESSNSSHLRRASYPNVPPSSGGPSTCCSRSGCTTAETSPSRTFAQPGRRRTPEDFVLWRVVGYPPLHFPHGHGVLLVHEALPSPYDPYLPTPPIVLTPHTSYDDLRKHFGSSSIINNNNNDDDREHFVWETGLPGMDKRLGEDVASAWEMVESVNSCIGKDRPDIARSKSFPNLTPGRDGGEADKFQEPYQAWPSLGNHRPHCSCWHADENGSGGSCRRSNSWGEQSSCAHKRSVAPLCCWNSDLQLASECSDNPDQDRTPVSTCDSRSKGNNCQSLFGLPDGSRAAVIGRLRQVVERRLSSLQDT